MSKEHVFVPKRPSVPCPVCGQESYQRIAEDGTSILLLGKGQRIDIKKGIIAWNCKSCGAEHQLSLFNGKIEKSNYDPRVTTLKKGKIDDSN